MIMFCVLIYCVATRLLSPLMPWLTKSKSIITSRLLGFRVESGLTFCRLSSIACRMRAIRIYMLRIFQHPNPFCLLGFFWRLSVEY